MRTEIAQLKVSYGIVDGKLEELRHLAIELQNSDGSSDQQKQEWLAQYAQALHEIEHEVYKKQQKNAGGVIGGGIVENTEYITKFSKFKDDDAYKAAQQEFTNKLKNLLGGETSNDNSLDNEDVDTWKLSDFSNFLAQQQQELIADTLVTETVDPLIIKTANTFTVMAREAIACIPRDEWSALDTASPNLDEAANVSNKITSHIVEALAIKDDYRRCLAFEFWLNVGNHCLDNGDFFSATAIADTFSKLPPAHVKMALEVLPASAKATFTALSKLSSKEGNFKALREVEQSYKGIITPSLRYYSSDILSQTKMSAELNKNNEALIADAVLATVKKEMLDVTDKQLAAGNAKHAARKQEIQSRVVKKPVKIIQKEDIAQKSSILAEPESRHVLWTCYGRKLDSEIVEKIKHLIDSNEYHSGESKQVLALNIVNKGQAIIKADAGRADMALEVTFKKFQGSLVVQGYKLTAYTENAKHFIPNFQEKIIAGEVETRISAKDAQEKLGITPKQLLQGNQKYLAKSPIKEQFARDVRELQAAIDTTAIKDPLERKRAETTERMLLAPIVGGLNIRSNKHDTWHPASDSTIPAAAFFSHGGRVMETLDNAEDAIDYLSWLFQVGETELASVREILNDKKMDSFKRAELAINQLLEKISSLAPDNPEAAKKAGKLLYVRQASTHTTKQTKFDAVQTATDGSVKTIKEVKSKAEGLRSFVTNVLNRVRGKQELTGHLGMTLAIGGLDNIAPDGSVIKADERSGHLFFQVKVLKDGTVSIMKGFEPSGPGSHKNVFGEGHSKLGNPGKFSPTGGLKFPKGKEPKKGKLTVWDGFEEEYGIKPPTKHDGMAVHLTKEVISTLKETPAVTTEMLAEPVRSVDKILAHGVSKRMVENPTSFAIDEWLKFSGFKARTEQDKSLLDVLKNYSQSVGQLKNRAMDALLVNKEQEQGTEQNQTKDQWVNEEDNADLRNLYAGTYVDLMPKLEEALKQTQRWLSSNPKHPAAEKVKALNMRLLIDQINVTYNYYQLFYKQLQLSVDEQIVSFKDGNLESYRKLYEKNLTNDHKALLNNLREQLEKYQENLVRGRSKLTTKQYETTSKLINQYLEKNRIALENIENKQNGDNIHDDYNPQSASYSLLLVLNRAFDYSALLELDTTSRYRITHYTDKFADYKNRLEINLAEFDKEPDPFKRSTLLEKRIKLLKDLETQYKLFLAEGDLVQLKLRSGATVLTTLEDPFKRLDSEEDTVNRSKSSKHNAKFNLSDAIAADIQKAKDGLEQVAKTQDQKYILARNLTYVIGKKASTDSRVAVIQRVITALSTCGLTGKTKYSHAPLISYLNNSAIEINLDNPEQVTMFLEYLAYGAKQASNKNSDKAISAEVVHLINSLTAKASKGGSEQTSEDTQKTSKVQKNVSKEPELTFSGFLLSIIPKAVLRWWESKRNSAHSKAMPSITQPAIESPSGAADLGSMNLQFPYNKEGNMAVLQLRVQDKKVLVTFQFPPKDQLELAVTEGKKIRIDAKELKGLQDSELGYKYSDQMLAEQPKIGRIKDQLGDNRHTTMHHNAPKAVQPSEQQSISPVVQPEADTAPGMGNGTSR